MGFTCYWYPAQKDFQSRLTHKLGVTARHLKTQLSAIPQFLFWPSGAPIWHQIRGLWRDLSCGALAVGWFLGRTNDVRLSATVKPDSGTHGDVHIPDTSAEGSGL